VYKILAIIGSARKKATFGAVQELEQNLKKWNEIIVEYAFLHDYDLKFCQGCLNCLDYGEDKCPLQDDRDQLLEKMENADGVILASPNYAFQVSARMKNFLDRFAYFYHRPYFFGKTFTAIITQGVFGGNKIRKYLESMGQNFGFNVVKGTAIKTSDPMTAKQEQKLKKKIYKTAKRFNKQLSRSKNATPSLYRLMMFRMSRNFIKNLDPKYKDHQYFKKEGWFESDYYYRTNLGPIKTIIGKFFDFMGRQMAKRK
jgi:multimeric flavodoxin WrbA